MSDRAKIVLILVTLFAVCGGAGLYFLQVHQPNSRLADARAEIAAWELRWTAVRVCLLGTAPASSRVSEALAVRELAPDLWDRKSCTAVVSRLTRGDAVDTRVSAVEAAWPAIDKAAQRLAVSFASHVDPGGDGMRRKPDPLPTALDELEAAYAALRRAARLPASPAPAGTAPLPSVTIIALEHGGKRVLSLQAPYLTSRAGLLVFGTTDGAELQLQIVAGAPPFVHRVGAGMQRAIPDASWGARALPDAVEIGAIDAAGTMQRASRLAVPGVPQVVAVVGTLGDGVVVYGSGNQLVVARGKAGVFTAGKPISLRTMAFATDPATGDTAIAWTGLDEKSAWLRLSTAALDPAIEELGAPGYVRKLCLTRDAAYVETIEAGATAIFSAGLTADSIHDGDASHHTLLGCSGDGAIASKRLARTTYVRCLHAGACEAVEHGTLRETAPMAVVGTAVIAAETRGGVLAIRTPSRSRFHAVPNGFVPLVAITGGETFELLGWTADGLVIARVPVTGAR